MPHSNSSACSGKNKPGRFSSDLLSPSPGSWLGGFFGPIKEVLLLPLPQHTLLKALIDSYLFMSMKLITFISLLVRVKTF